MGSYDYSLQEKLTKSEYKVCLFNLEKDTNDIANIYNDPNIQVVYRKDYFCEKTGEIFVHIEYRIYSIEKTSPFEPANDLTREVQ